MDGWMDGRDGRGELDQTTSTTTTGWSEVAQETEKKKCGDTASATWQCAMCEPVIYYDESRQTTAHTERNHPNINLVREQHHFLVAAKASSSSSLSRLISNNYSNYNIYNNMDDESILEAWRIYDNLSAYCGTTTSGGFLCPLPSPDSLCRLPARCGRHLFGGRDTLLHRICHANTKCWSRDESSSSSYSFLQLARAVVDLCPQACYMYSQPARLLPLHALVQHSPAHASSDAFDKYMSFLQYLIEQGPLALLKPTRDDRRVLPLHIAVAHAQPSLAIVNLLLHSFPETIHYRDAQQKMPLECALVRQRRQRRQFSGYPPPSLLPVVERLIQASPVLLSFVLPHTQGMLLLHKYVLQILEPHQQQEQEAQNTTQAENKGRDEEFRILQRLVEACPGALRVQASVPSATPLVMACTRNLDVTCIYTLLRAWPEQVTTQREMIFGAIHGDDEDEDDDDKAWNGILLPTHLLSADLSWKRARRWLDSKDAQVAATTPDAAGRLALHYAVVSQASCVVRLVQTLVALHPNAARHADRANRLPLHYLALSSHPDREIVLELLLDAANHNQATTTVHDDAGGLAVADIDGCLPWMYAELTRFTAVYEASMEHCDVVNMDHTQDMPVEVRWDIVQVAPEEEDDDDYYES